VNGRLQDLTRRRAGIRQVVLRRYLVVTEWAVLTADTDERSFAWAACTLRPDVR
jgi:hypothetical protein